VNKIKGGTWGACVGSSDMSFERDFHLCTDPGILLMVVCSTLSILGKDQDTIFLTDSLHTLFSLGQ